MFFKQRHHSRRDYGNRPLGVLRLSELVKHSYSRQCEQDIGFCVLRQRSAFRRNRRRRERARRKHFQRLRQPSNRNNKRRAFDFGDAYVLSLRVLERGGFRQQSDNCRQLRLYGCKSLDNVTLPSSVERIGNYAFYGCSSLKTLVLNEGLKQIGTSAFLDCNSIETIVLPSTVTDIGNYAFRGCSSLSGITLSLSVTTLGNHVFYGCNTLTIYCESKAAGENWGARWNSGYRPVVYGCVLSSDKSFVQAVEKKARWKIIGLLTANQ